MDRENRLSRLKKAMEEAEAILIGAGAGLSTAAGYTYAGERFTQNFADFIAAYHFSDMYSAGFYPFDTEEEKWAYWSRHIYCNRYDRPKSAVHENLLHLVKDKDYFVLTTNVDHLFQNNGFAKERLFYTQGDYGLWQCKTPCHAKTYDNETTVRRMVAEQKDRRVPSELIPRCPVCGGLMEMNLRCDDTFVEDEGWKAAAARYHAYLKRHQNSRILYWELGVGLNTPGIIKFPFWNMTAANSKATFACINADSVAVPDEIATQSIGLKGDIKEILATLGGEAA
ncbi:MAG: Sir2 silent information regulator family NAD-dependent deacetylase [Selenomonadaceae bacterium]|nr:Sir2 silent information regulator family NAD-dependent deacetylase [Selenomonadaceae bacterium]